MRTIRKKCWPPEFAEVSDGRKRYELRLADFEVSPGDLLILEEWDPERRAYTGRTLETVVTIVGRTKPQPYWPAEQVDEHGFYVLQIEPHYRGSAEPASVKPGWYEHYKGGRYRVLGVGRHSETKEWLVLYEHPEPDRSYWVRPLAMFTETVSSNGRSVPRFRYVGPA